MSVILKIEIWESHLQIREMREAILKLEKWEHSFWDFQNEELILMLIQFEKIYRYIGISTCICIVRKIILKDAKWGVCLEIREMVSRKILSNWEKEGVSLKDFRMERIMLRYEKL